MPSSIPSRMRSAARCSCSSAMAGSYQAGGRGGTSGASRISPRWWSWSRRTTARRGRVVGVGAGGGLGAVRHSRLSHPAPVDDSRREAGCGYHRTSASAVDLSDRGDRHRLPHRPAPPHRSRSWDARARRARPHPLDRHRGDAGDLIRGRGPRRGLDDHLRGRRHGVRGSTRRDRRDDHRHPGGHRARHDRRPQPHPVRHLR